MTVKAGLSIADIIGNRHDQIVQLANKHGASNVRVFGSVARGEAKPDSDLDLLVDWDYAHISSWGGIGLTLELEALLERKVDVVSVKALHPSIRESVLREATSL